MNLEVSQLIEQGYTDGLNITGLYAVMSPYGEHLQLTGCIEQARKFKRKLMRQYPEKSFGLFAMRGSWESYEAPRMVGHVLAALECAE